jgi:hypothetical protein
MRELCPLPLSTGAFNRPATRTKLPREEVQLTKTGHCIRDRDVGQQTAIAIKGNNRMTAGMWIQAERDHKKIPPKKGRMHR